MATITLRAHFDGNYIQLDEPFELPPNTELIVTVLPTQPSSEEDAEWSLLSMQGLAAAYGEGEPEYSLTPRASTSRKALG